MGGGPSRRAPSTSLPQFLTKKEEFSTYPSSGLCWTETQHVEGESCSPARPIFQVSVAAPSRCPPWRIGSQEHSPVRSTVGATSLSGRSSQKGCTPRVIDSRVRLDLIFRWSLGDGKPRINFTRQVVKVASVAPMKCIYELCLVYNCWGGKEKKTNKWFLLPKVAILSFQWPRINVRFLRFIGT